MNVKSSKSTAAILREGAVRLDFWQQTKIFLHTPPTNKLSNNEATQKIFYFFEKVLDNFTKLKYNSVTITLLH